MNNTSSSIIDIPKGTEVALVVCSKWAKLHGVRIFLSENEQPRSDDTSHTMFVVVLDSDDSRGLWIERKAADHKQGQKNAGQFKLLVPWSYVVTIVVADQFSKEIRDAVAKIGYNPRPHKSMTS